MLDLLMLVIGFGFFAACLGYLAGCVRLRRGTMRKGGASQ